MCPRKAAGGTSSPQVLSLGDQQHLGSTSCSWTGQLADFFTSGLHLLSISSSKSCSPDTKVLSLHCNHQCPKRPYSFGMLLIPRNVSSALTPSLVSANTSFLFPHHFQMQTPLRTLLPLLTTSSSRGWPKQQQQLQGM